jgi:hypothetical protein
MDRRCLAIQIFSCAIQLYLMCAPEWGMYTLAHSLLPDKLRAGFE